MPSGGRCYKGYGVCLIKVLIHNIIFFISCRSYIEYIHKKEPEFYEGDAQLPIFAHISSAKKHVFQIADSVRCLLHPLLQKSYYCPKVPTLITSNVSFIVDTSALEDYDDICCDDMGTWKNNRVDKSFFAVKLTENAVDVAKCASQKKDVYMAKRVYRIHGTDKSLKKITTTLYGK